MNREEALKSRQQDRLGLFIRWGLHSLTGQDGQLMYRERIPVKEYEKRAAQLEGAQFDPEEWVRLAREAGMGYVVVTAKGCDGFSMFQTRIDSFNACEATPMGRDVVGELAAVCRRADMPLGVLYAHACDWRHPMAQSLEAQGDAKLVNRGNFWDYPAESRKNLQTYLDEYALAQLNELLTRYGKLFTVRFDQPFLLRPDQAEQIRSLVREKQPDCTISGTLCAGEETDSACAEAGGLSLRWEEIMRSLADAISRGAGLLVSVYPQGDGSFSEGDRRALMKTGAWLKANGEAMYGAEGSPFRYEPSWGRITRKGNCLYLIVTDPAARAVTLTGLQSRVRACSVLDGGKELAFEETHDDSADIHRLTVQLTGVQGSFRAVRVETENGIRISTRLGPDSEGRISLPVSCADRQQARLRWVFHIDRPGRYLLWIGVKQGASGEISVELDGSIHAMDCEGGQSLKAGEVALAPGRHVIEVWADRTEQLTGCLLNPM